MLWSGVVWYYGQCKFRVSGIIRVRVRFVLGLKYGYDYGNGLR